ncbi:solute carrier family 22 [Echinococcus multilocularis]|uniref:Solute carrier family 22 n=1 Tax=Echinococcus multilocularis TaxID=6211 RepID=A0A068YF94_ECHMU|nr:solute carrier family 22 [Echinococcus multilocularis]
MYGTQIDQIFETLVGGLGAWQVWIILLISLSFSNNMIISVFFNSVPRHRCRADAALEAWFQGFNFTYVARFLGPVDESNNHFRQCQRYAGRAPTNITTSALFEFYRSARDHVITANYTCFDGYVFEYSEVQYKGGIVQQWELVCDEAWQLPFNESAYMVGMMVGFIFGGWLSDRVGRRKAMVISGCGEILAGLATALSLSHWFYVIGRVVLATFVTARGSAYVVLTAEITTAKCRSTLSAIGMVLQIILQGCIIGILAIYVTNWRLFIILNNLPSILVILHIWLLPESPRWLAACGRAEEAAHILYSAYRFNSRFRRPQPEVLMTTEEFLQHVGLGPSGRQDVILRNIRLRAIYSSNESASEFAIWQLFKPHLIKITLLSTSILTCQITCIFGMVFFASNIKLHVSFVTIVNSLAQIPGCILAAALYRYCKSRRLPLLVVYVVVVIMGAVAAFHTMYFQPTTDAMLNMYSNVIILFLSAAQRMLFIYVPELYKPIYRNRGFGLAAGMARLGALWFPVINRLDKEVMHGLPLVVYTFIMVLQLVLILFLEDTTGLARRSIITVSPIDERVETEEPLQTQENPSHGL